MTSIQIADLTDNTDLTPRQMQTVRGGVFDKASPKICESWKVEEGESWKVEEGESFVPVNNFEIVQIHPIVPRPPVR